MKKPLIITMFALLYLPMLCLQLTLSSCSNDDSSINQNINDDMDDNDNEDDEHLTGKYIWWTKEDINVDDGYPVLSVRAKFVKEGKIWDTPYRYSTDGINWVTTQWDGVTFRSFINFSGNFWAERSYTSVLNLTYTSVHGTGTLILDRLTTGVNPLGGAGEEGNLAWDG